MSFHYREGTHQTRTVHDIGSEAHSRRQLFGVNLANWKNIPDVDTDTTDSHDLAPSPGDVSDLAMDNTLALAAEDVKLHHDYLSGDRDVLLVAENERLRRQIQQQEKRHQLKNQQKAQKIRQQEEKIKQQEKTIEQQGQTIEQLQQQIKKLQESDSAHNSVFTLE